MAVQKASKNVAPFQRKYGGKTAADGYLNLSIHPKKGEPVRIDQGIALYANSRLGRSLLNAKAAFDADSKNKDKEFTVTLTGTVNIVDPEQGDIEF